MTATRLVVRRMLAGDIAEATRVANAAFAVQVGVEALFTERVVRARWQAHPTACFVAAGPDEGAPAVGMLLSVTRGTLGWLGPLAVDPAAQNAGWGRRLVDECVQTWDSRGVRLMGLETIAASPFHVRFYASMGFRPSWVGLHLEKILPADRGATTLSPPTRTALPGDGLPDLEFLYPGVDLTADIEAARASGELEPLVTDDGLALVSVRPQSPDATAGSVTFLAARSVEGFHSLISRAEEVGRAAGFRSLSLRVPGSAPRTLDALHDRGFRIGGAMIRMKRGLDLDYDSAELYYADNWL